MALVTTAWWVFCRVIAVILSWELIILIWNFVFNVKVAWNKQTTQNSFTLTSKDHFNNLNACTAIGILLSTAYLFFSRDDEIKRELERYRLKTFQSKKIWLFSPLKPDWFYSAEYLLTSGLILTKLEIAVRSNVFCSTIFLNFTCLPKRARQVGYNGI